jgi:16S rRNA (adenine1518-N6/adenine1519-N6)-dimethyltransferase
MEKIVPKRRFSQNFLRDLNVVKDIVEAGNFFPADNVVEIGPGYGALTQLLIKKLTVLSTVEVDRDAIRYLRSQFSDSGIEIVEADFLDVDLTQFGKSLRLIGNLPYHISTPILFKVDAYMECVQDAMFMLQREVVDRLVAEPGSPSYGKLTITMQLRWQLEKLFDVPPEAFDPKPKVWSSILYLKPRDKAYKVDRSVFRKIVFGAFSKRRKTLRNALKGIVEEEQFKSAIIDSGRRPETLSIDDYVRLSNVVSGS